MLGGHGSFNDEEVLYSKFVEPKNDRSFTHTMYRGNDYTNYGYFDVFPKTWYLEYSIRPKDTGYSAQRSQLICI